MKTAKVIPLYKSRDPQVLSNYRPISILTSMSKLLEKLVCNRLRKFLEKFDLLFKHQFGFRTGTSTEHAITILKDHISKEIDSGNYTVGLFLDFSKAFDTIDHDILF